MVQKEQEVLLEMLALAKGSVGKRLDLLYFLAKHPWLHLQPDQVADAIGFLGPLRGVSDQQDALLNLVEARLRSFVQEGCRVAVFSMPKSGSTYLSDLMTKVLGVPRVNLDTCAESNTNAGCNAREDELDEFALVQSTLVYGSWVAQHHTKASASLMYLLRNYQVYPIVMVRNILDCIVSMDDMMMEWNSAESEAASRGQIFFNTGGRLPYNFVSLDAPERYRILLEAWGRWYLEFYISWKRAKLSQFCSPLITRYEEHVSNPEALSSLLAESLGLDSGQVGRLDQSVGQRVRFNKGVVGRGAMIPVEQRDFLRALASGFGEELAAEELHYLVDVQ